jgi:hypothetical protein
LNFEDDRDSGRGRKSATSTDGQQPDSPTSRKKKGSSPEVGHALRAAYQRTINEDIPPEMLDLLGRLG